VEEERSKQDKPSDAKAIFYHLSWVDRCPASYQGEKKRTNLPKTPSFHFLLLMSYGMGYLFG